MALELRRRSLTATRFFLLQISGHVASPWASICLVMKPQALPGSFARICSYFRGSAFRAVGASIVLALTLGVAWIVLSSLGRAATLKALIAYFRESSASTADLEEKSSWRLRSLSHLMPG